MARYRQAVGIFELSVLSHRPVSMADGGFDPSAWHYV